MVLIYTDLDGNLQQKRMSSDEMVIATAFSLVKAGVNPNTINILEYDKSVLN